MLTLIIVLICSAAGAVAGRMVLDSTGWAVFLGIVGFITPAILINLWAKKRLEAIFMGVQALIEKDQEALRRKMNLMQARMSGSGKGLQQQLEQIQAQGIRNALKQLEPIQKLHKWNLLAERQANTLRAQLCFQIKDFGKADQYLEKALLMDPFVVAIKMARLYAAKDMEALEKTFSRGIRRFKNEKGILLYALYSWILVKQDRVDEAVALLAEAKEKTEDETLAANWEHLANGRVRRFSNANFGDQWYALHLETPKPVRIKQRGGRQFR